MTYYKYAERDATSRVNWSDVSKKWTDEINQIAADRDKKRTEIQTATDELSDKLLNAPMGENKGINSFTATLSEMSTQYLLDANRKLKSGDIKPRDYMELMSNLKQGTSALYDTAKKYSDVYGEKMERLRNGDSQPMEEFLMTKAEAMGNFTESNPIINPSNGMLSVYDRTGRIMSVPRMNAAIVSQYDYYDYETEMAQRADQLGKVINVIMEGDVKTLEQARQMEGYTKVEDDYLDAALEDGLHVSSLLTVDMPGYNLSDDASKAGDNDVLLVLHPRQPSTGIMVPLYDFVDDIAAMESSQQEAKLDEIFGADLSNEERANLLRIAGEQKKEAREFLRRDLRSRQNEIETPQAEFPEQAPSQPSAAEKAGLKKTEIGVTNLQKIWGATTLDELRQAIGYFEGLNPDLKLTVDKIDGVRTLGIKKGDADTKFFDITEDYDGFVEAVSTELLGDVTYVDEAKRLSPLDREKYPTLGKATGSGQRRYIPDRGKIGEELVDLGEEQFTVDAVLQGLGGANTPDGVPVVSGLASFLGTGMSEADQNALMENAVAGLNVLFSSKLDPQDEVSVRGIVASQASGDYPEIEVTVNGEDRVFSVAEGEFGNLKNYAKELLGKIGQKKAELD